jgi:hypothetical protein
MKGAAVGRPCASKIALTASARMMVGRGEAASYGRHAVSDVLSRRTLSDEPIALNPGPRLPPTAGARAVGLGGSRGPLPGPR